MYVCMNGVTNVCSSRLLRLALTDYFGPPLMLFSCGIVNKSGFIRFKWLTHCVYEWIYR